MARAHPSTALFAATPLGGCQETLGEQQPVFQVGVSASTYSQGILRSRKAGGHHHRVMFHVEHDRSPESLRTRLRRRLLVDEGLSGFYVSRSETSLRRRPDSQYSSEGAPIHCSVSRGTTVAQSVQNHSMCRPPGAIHTAALVDPPMGPCST